MIRIFTRQIERLQSEEGQAMVFVALVGLIIFLFFAMTMNVAELVNTKIKNQNAADAAALSAAAWQARTLNLVSAANRNMIEHWGVGLAALYATGITTLGCAYVCSPFSIDPIFCIVCLIIAAIEGAVALSFIGAGATNGPFQDFLLDGIDMNVVDADLPQVVRQNYAFKPNTQFDDVGVYLFDPDPGDDLIPVYVPGQPEVGNEVLERVGICEMLVMVIRYANYLWHLTDQGVGLTDTDWQTDIVPLVNDWYGVGGACYQTLGIPATLPPEAAVALPLGLRSRMSDWSAQNVDSLLAMTVATYKAQEPPSVLGKGFDAGDCAWQEGDTRFACPSARHYAFSSAHAYSESASRFYNTLMAGLPTSYLIPYIPFEMDWEPRLFPLEPYPNGAESARGGYVAYEAFANQIPEGSDYFLNNVLMLPGGVRLFLY
jgi:hypothetical protein